MAGDPTDPVLTVIVTAFNHAPYVEQALDSVLAEGIDGLELVICDDASSDGTPEVIRAWTARARELGMEPTLLLHQSNIGLPATLNGALARSRAPLFCMLSADDYYQPGGLRRLLDAMLTEDAAVAAVYADAEQVDAEGSLLHPSTFEMVMPGVAPADGDVFAAVHRVCYLSVMAVVMRRSAVQAVGEFDESLPFEDWPLWLRLADRYPIRLLPEVVASRRVLATSMFHSQSGTPQYQRAFARMMAAWLDRDETARRTSAFWIRRAARIIATEDRVEARALLRSVAQVPRLPEDDGHWDALAALLLVPGSGRVLPVASDVQRRARALLQAEAGAWRSGRRLPHPATQA